jgi:hypothetical protein
MKTKTVKIDETDYTIAALSLGWFRNSVSTDAEKTPASNIDHMVNSIQTSLKRAGTEATTDELLENLDFGSANALFKEVMILSGLSMGEAAPA